MVANSTMENSQPKIVKYIAHLLSYVLHPLFIPTYFFLFLMQVLPFEFVGITEWQLKMRLFSVAWLTAFFPAFAVFLLWTAVILVSVFYPVNNAVWVLLAVLLTALVISARLVVSDHTKKELIVGLFIGVFTQVAAYLWVV